MALKVKIEENRQRLRDEQSSKKPSDKVHASQQSGSNSQSLKRWTTLTKLDLVSKKSSSEVDFTIKSEEGIERQSRMKEHLSVLFKKKEQGRIKQILQQKFGIFKRDLSSSKSSKSPDQVSHSITNELTPSKSSLKMTRNSQAFFDHLREKSVSFNEIRSSGYQITGLDHMKSQEAADFPDVF